MTKPTYHSVNVDGLDVFYRKAGDSADPILLHKRADHCPLYPQDGHAQNGHQGLLSAINRHLSGNSRVLKAAIYATEAPPQGEERRG
jgi:hypothetical protein